MELDYLSNLTRKRKRSDNNSNKSNKKSKKDPKSIFKNSGSVFSKNNRIYFYDSVDKHTITELIKLLGDIEEEHLDYATKNKFNPAPIYLHINSFGGHVFQAFNAVDYIERMRVPVYTVIDGCAASAATIISVVGKKRFIGKYSFMLVHQLSSSFWGKLDKIEDEVENLRKLMNTIKNIYKKHTKMDKKKLDGILFKDLWWSSDECISQGLVDEILT